MRLYVFSVKVGTVCTEAAKQCAQLSNSQCDKTSLKCVFDSGYFGAADATKCEQGKSAHLNF